MLDHGKASAVGRAGSITLRCHPRHRAPEDCLGNKDRDDIIDSLSSIFRDARMACYGWALMSNHCPSPKLDPTSLKKQNCHFGHYFN